MPCCCVEILNLCDKPVCGVLTLNKEAGAESGESGDVNNYTLVLDYFQNQITLTEAQTEGENIHFDITSLNENFQFIGKVYDSAGTLVTFTENDIVYDCIKFKTVVNISGQGDSEETDDLASSLPYTRVTEDNYEIQESEYVLSVNNGVENWGIILPSPIGITGKVFIIKRYSDLDTGVVTITSAAGLIQNQLGEFEGSVALPGWPGGPTFQSNGINWERLSP